MTSEHKLTAIVVCTITVAALILVSLLCYLDKRMQRIMVEHGMCYQAATMTNTNPMWEYQVCK